MPNHLLGASASPKEMNDQVKEDYMFTFKRMAIYFVMLLVAVVVIALLSTLSYDIYRMIFDSDFLITTKAEVLAFIGMFLLVIIAFELMDILYLYSKTQKIHVEVVLLVGLTAVSRELIVFNYEANDGVLIAGLGVLIASLSVAYFLIRKVYHEYGVNINGNS
jgi:uncharacterized membrane protein (DUF373 family)